MLVHLLERTHPVVEELRTQRVPADPADVFVPILSLQIIVTDENIVDVIDFKRQMMRPGILASQNKDHVMINQRLTAIDTGELAEQVVGRPDV